MYDVISDKPEFHVHISECFRSYSALISAKRFLTETETQTVRILCSGFGNFTKFFPYRNITRKIHKRIFDVQCFLAKHKALEIFGEDEGESFHNSINKQLLPYQGDKD